MNRHSAFALIVAMASASFVQGCSADTSDEPADDGDRQSSALSKTGAEEPTDTFPTFDPNPRPSVQSIASTYTGFDMDGDGIAEIRSLSLMSFEPATPLGSGANGLAIVLVDPRVANALSPALQVHRDDLVAAGYHTRFLVADVYSGVEHQDGLTLLAMRRFLRSVWGHYPSLRGVTLVGSFPEATLFRRVLFREDNAKTGSYLTVHPERVNPRADIVLGDLDGNWESLYAKRGHMENIRMRVTTPSWPYDDQFLTGTIDRHGYVDWEDVFYVQDDSVTRMTAETQPGATIVVHVQSSGQRNPELTSADRTLPNPIARPEIDVSRIDARGIAVEPKATIPDRNGSTAFVAGGVPQTLTFDFQLPEDWLVTWERDPALEIRILLDYFARNHAHRLGVAGGANPSAHRTAAVRQRNSGLVSAADANTMLRQADPTGFGTSIGFQEADLGTYLDFLRTPATLRALVSHSTGRISGYGEPSSWAGLASGLGNRVWAWKATNNADGSMTLAPNVEAFRYGDADWRFARSVFESGAMQGVGQTFYVHLGCSVNVPDENWSYVSYDDAVYGERNNADSTLLLQNGLAILARGKVFNDAPIGFGPSVANAGGRFGAAWKGAFTTHSLDANAKPGTNGDVRVLHNKQSYFWALRGDWTAKLRY